jgi:hypothetical protein
MNKLIQSIKESIRVNWRNYLIVIVVAFCTSFMLSYCGDKNITRPFTSEGSTLESGWQQADTEPTTAEDLLDQLAEQEGELDSLLAELEERDAAIAALQRVRARGTGSRETTELRPEVTADGSGVVFIPVHHDLAIDFESVRLPVGHVDLNESGILSSTTYDLDLELTNVITSEQGGMSTISRLQATVNGETYTLPIEAVTRYDLEAVTVPGQPDLRRIGFHPSVSLGLSFASTVTSFDPIATAGIGVSLIDYRNSEGVYLWQIITPSFHISSDFNPYLGISPGAYNLGSNIPGLSDLWIGPQVLWNQNWYVGFTLSTRL